MLVYRICNIETRIEGRCRAQSFNTNNEPSSSSDPKRSYTKLKARARAETHEDRMSFYNLTPSTPHISPDCTAARSRPQFAQTTQRNDGGRGVQIRVGHGAAVARDFCALGSLWVMMSSTSQIGKILLLRRGWDRAGK